MAFGATAAGAAGALTVTPTTTVLAPPSSTTSLSGLNVSGDTTDLLQVIVGTSLGTLAISTTTGLTLAYGNSWSGTQSIAFTGLEGPIDTALAGVTLTNTGTTGTAQIALTALVSQAGVNYLPSNQHFYQYVACSGCSWTTADTNAQTLSLDGQAGYLATIPNAVVNSFISTKIANASDVWFGARAYESEATDGSQVYAVVGGVTYARVWRWTEGATESPIAGGVISECTSETGTCNFSNGSSFYSSWNSGEPNNSGGGSVAYKGEYVAVTNWSGTSGSWNDLSPTNDASVNGYVVEFGGKTNSDPSLGTGFAGVVTASSNVLVATSASVPSAPSVTAAPGNATAAISWAPPAANGATITSYQVSTNNGGTWTMVTTSSSTVLVNGNDVTTVSAAVSGLTNGTTYEVEVRAVNSAGAGAVSSAVGVTPVTVPGAPTNVSATSGNTSATVTFTAPSSNGGSAITSYTVTVSPGAATVSCSASPCGVTGLTNGTPYTFTVYATTAVGNSVPSGASAAVTPATVPGAPTGVTAAAGNGSISVGWTAPAVTGGSPVTGYTVTVSPGGATASCSASPCSVTGLTNGTAYSATVHATNAVGNSGESGASASVTPATVPGAPTSFATVGGNATASVSFGVPANNGSAISGYQSSIDGGATWQNLSVSGTTLLTATITGLTNGTSYGLEVRAVNGVGGGAVAGPLATIPVTVPGAPTGVSATAGNGSISVGWTAPAVTGGSPVTGYTVTVSPGGATASCSASPCSVTGLTNGTASTTTVHATNAAGNSVESSSSAAVTPATVPGAPTSFAAQAGNTTAGLAFGAPANNGSAITGYQSSIDGGTTWQALTVTGSTTLTATLTGLTNGTSYGIEVRAVNGVGAGAAAGPVTTIPVTVPGAPTGASATAGNGSISVSWTAPVGNGGAAITGYTVTVSPGGATAFCSVGPCSVTGLTNGTPYTATVYATNAVGNGAVSGASAAVTPATVPGAPTGASATAGNGSISVSWTAPVGNGGAAITGYTVTVSPGGATAFCSVGPCSVTGLTNGTPYTATVYATNAVGNGAVSGASAAVVPATVPGAPTSLTVQGGNTTASLTFGTPADNGSGIIGYQSSIDGGASWQNLSVTGTTLLTATITGLTNGTSYGIEVRAVNGVGGGAVAGPLSTIPVTVPGAPTSVSATAGDHSVSVTWTAPAGDGGSPVTSYTVTVSPGGATAFCSVSPCSVTGLSNGVAYTATVQATNAVGDSVASSPSAPVTPATVPGAPTSFTVQPGNGSASLVFEAAATDGSGIIGYQSSIDGGASWQALTVTGTTTLTATITGLINGTSYGIEVRAVNGVGDGAVAGPLSIIPVTVPGVPTGASAGPGNGSIDVSWTAPAGTGGSPITSYTVTVSPGGATTSCSASPCSVTGLSNGTAYTATVYATNAVGDSVASSPSAPVTPATVPGSPTSFTTQPGNGSAVLVFDPPADNGSAIIGYQYSIDGGTTWPALSVSGMTPLTATITGLTNGTSYGIEVRAVNGVGDGAVAGPLSTIPVTVPGAPTAVSAAPGNGSISVSWTAPAGDGGSPISSYTVTVSPGGATASCSASPCSVTGLGNGTAYTATVDATNAVGDSVASSPSAAVIPATVPGAPTSFTVQPGNGTAVLVFGAPADNGSAIIGYQYSIDGGTTWPALGVTGTTTVTATVTGLTNGTSFGIEVRAVNGVGDGAVAGPLSTVPVTVPGAPTSVSATAGDHSASVSWTPPADDGGSPITGYTVTVSPGGATASCSVSPCTVAGLTNGTLYSVTVEASNAVGNSVTSTSGSVTPARVPYAPTSFTVQPGDGSAALSFDAPASNGLAITGYQYSIDGGTTWLTLSVTGSTPLTATVTGLTNGALYGIEIRGVNDFGGGSVAGPLPVMAVTVPRAPTGVSVSAGDGSVSVSWTGPMSDGGSPISGYLVTPWIGTVAQAPDLSTGPGLSDTVGGLVDGTTYTFSVETVTSVGASVPSAASSPSTPVASASAVPTGGSAAATPDGAGYWSVSPGGELSNHGDAVLYGSENGAHLDAPIVAITSTISGDGYWETASDGGVFAFGDAPYYGSMAGVKLDQPIVAMARTPDDGGYWLVGADGGVFTFGNAAYYGTVTTLHLVGAIVGMVSTPSGQGYWLVGSDGGVFSFGDATFYGSLGGVHLNKPIVGMASTPDGHGYWLVGMDGGVFRFGGAEFYGSLGGTGTVAIGGIVADDIVGYRLISSDGAAYPFGTTP
jgi:titin